jgi:hypothetical protein
MYGLTEKVDNALGLFSEGAWFESRQETPAILTGCFVVAFSPSKQIPK